MKRALQILSICLITIGFTSCDKFPDGGAKKKAENNLTNIWQLDKYFLDGGDKTSELVISNYEETFADNGTYTRFYTDGSSSQVSQLGTWTLDAENSEVKFTGGGAMDLTSSVTGVSTSVYTIQKLTKKEFRYTFESGGNTHFFWMKAKEQ